MRKRVVGLAPFNGDSGRPDLHPTSICTPQVNATRRHLLHTGSTGWPSVVEWKLSARSTGSAGPAMKKPIKT